MRNYRLTFWGKAGRREGTFPLMAQTDKDAFDRANAMLSGCECASLEIWRDTFLLARVSKNSTPVALN
jgi:hypothetical protein